jgi:hypothetical protein
MAFLVVGCAGTQEQGPGGEAGDGDPVRPAWHHGGQVAKDPRVHLVGYGPSASTIGANRAGRAAARELMAFLGEEKR